MSLRRPLRVLFLLEDLCYGGTQKQNLALAARLDRSRFAPAILTLTGPTDMDASVQDMPLRHMGATRSVAPVFFLRLAGFLRELAPDLLVACTALPNIWGRIWGRALRLPVIVGTCRGGGALARQHERFLWRLADGIVCNSRPLRDSLLALGLPGERLAWIGNGVDAEHFQNAGVRRAGSLIVSVARLAKDKDHMTLLKAFAMLAPEFPAARLRLVGDGPEQGCLRAWSAMNLAPGIASRVEFCGACQDPAPHYAAADIFALSSVREGQPNAILEAMSSELPVCATDVGGIPELVTDNGLLCPPGDAAALAVNLRLLLGNGELRRRMGASGRQRVVRDFSFAAMTSRHEDFFLHLWDKRKCA